MNAATSPSGRAGGSLASRLVVAAIAISGFAALAWADAVGYGGAPPVAWLLPLAVATAVLGGLEVVRLAAARGHDIGGATVPVAAAAIAAAPALGAWVAPNVAAGPLAAPGCIALACSLVLAALFVREIIVYRPGAGALTRIAGGFVAAAALGLPLAFMAGLRLLDPKPGAGGGLLAGLVPLVSLIAVVKAADIAAYGVGSLVGRHRMAPLLSPGKTWEGAAAALAGAVAAAWFVLESSGSHLQVRPLGGWLGFGLAVGLAGMVGDLAESLVKRELGAKDSGRSLGGMGGVLDLVDSLLVAAPVAWALWIAGG